MDFEFSFPNNKNEHTCAYGHQMEYTKHLEGSLIFST